MYCWDARQRAIDGATQSIERIGAAAAVALVYTVVRLLVLIIASAMGGYRIS
jgi:hypothetical protein